VNRDVALADLEHARECVAQARARVADAMAIDQAHVLERVESWLRQAYASIDRATNELRS